MESLEFLPAYSDCKRFFVTFERSQAKDLLKNEKVYFVTDPKRNPIKLLQNLNQAINILKKENPDVVISTGAAAAVPICYAAKMFGKKNYFHRNNSSCRQTFPFRSCHIPNSGFVCYSMEKLEKIL